MDRLRTHSAPARLSTQPAVSQMTPADINHLAVRIHGIKSIPLDKGARLTAFFDCVSRLDSVPAQLLPMIVGELHDAADTLPPRQSIDALAALFGAAPMTIRYQRSFR